MLGVAVLADAIFHVKTKRRRNVLFHPALRDNTRRAAERLHDLLAQTAAPLPMLHPKCKQCSVSGVCLPELVSEPIGYARAANRLFIISRG